MIKSQKYSIFNYFFKGHHASIAQKALTDFVVFDKAIGQGLKQTDIKETLIAVTADHSHVLVFRIRFKFLIILF